MKGLLLILLLLTGLRAQEPYDSFPMDTTVFTPGNAREYAEFTQLMNKFNRKLGGCPPKGPLTDCIVGAGIFDVKLWKELNEKSRRVFTYGQQKDGKVRSDQPQK